MKKAKIKVLYADCGDYDITNAIYINKHCFDRHIWAKATFDQLEVLIRKNHFGWDIKDQMLKLINTVENKQYQDFSIEYVKMN